MAFKKSRTKVGTRVAGNLVYLCNWELAHGSVGLYAAHEPERFYLEFATTSDELGIYLRALFGDEGYNRYNLRVGHASASTLGEAMQMVAMLNTALDGPPAQQKG